MSYVSEYMEEVRAQIEGALAAFREQADPDRRADYEPPLETETVFMVLSHVCGYRATWKTYRYLSQNKYLSPLPKKIGRRLAWSVPNTVDFAMELERRRYWQPGWHMSKKTCFEKEADLEELSIERDPWEWATQASRGQLLDKMAETEDEAVFHALAAALDSRVPTDAPARVWRLLTRLEDAGDPQVRKDMAQDIKAELEGLE